MAAQTNGEAGLSREQLSVLERLGSSVLELAEAQRQSNLLSKEHKDGCRELHKTTHDDIKKIRETLATIAERLSDTKEEAKDAADAAKDAASAAREHSGKFPIYDPKEDTDKGITVHVKKKDLAPIAAVVAKVLFPLITAGVGWLIAVLQSAGK